MKLKNIFIGGLGVMALTACNDYLDVDAPSKYDPATIYSSAKDVKQALNGVYADILSSNTFGQAYTYSLVLNSDVDYVSNTRETKQTDTPKRYDVDASSGTAKKTWDATYAGIENANNFCHYLSTSGIYTPSNENYAELQQYMGEAKVLRAMLYYELLCYWGDVPFTLEPTSETQNFVPAITSRDVIAKALIEDLAAAAPTMSYARDNADGIERVSKEACWAMIARIALQASGYSLRHAEGDETSYGYMGTPSEEDTKYFLEKARLYADSVITSGTHVLSESYQDVFLNECNFTTVEGDDPIFELPFAKDANGYIGYRQGPKFASSGGETNYQWGECGGNQGVESLYRYSFKEGDTRKDCQSGWFYYTYDGTPTINAGYSLYNMKWSKLYNKTNAFTKITTGNTGINFPYIRYADVLLTYAEADLKLTKTVNQKAKDCVMQVRNRAFQGSAVPEVAATDSASFLKEILDERKWEFAGENMRWKDLVRNNQLGEALYWTFMRYYAVAEDAGVGCSWSDEVQNHDGIAYFDNAMLPNSINYIWIENPNEPKLFANSSLPMIYVMNEESSNTSLKTTDELGMQKHSDAQVKQNPQLWFDDNNLPYKAIAKPNDGSATAPVWQVKQDFYSKWYDEDGGYPQAAVRYSLYGYIRGGSTSTTYGNVYIIENGIEKQITPGVDIPTTFPAVRYLLPIPREAITRSNGVYKNYYGY